MVQCQDGSCRNKTSKVLLGVFGRSAGKDFVGSDKNGQSHPRKERPAYLCEYHMKLYLGSKRAKIMYVDDYEKLVSQGYSCNQIYDMIDRDGNVIDEVKNGK